MRVKETHPLSCISTEAAGDHSSMFFRPGCVEQDLPTHLSASVVAGMLFKWTSYRKGWRCRWFVLQNGVLSYSKIRTSPDDLMIRSLSGPAADNVVVRVIGEVVSSPPAPAPARLPIPNCRRSKAQRPTAVVHLNVASFRESRSDDKKLYIFTSTKTLHLRANTNTERVAWIEALASTRGLFSLRRNHLPVSPSTTNLSVSTERLKRRLVDEGVDHSLVEDCEQIMLSEFSQIQGRVKVLYEERSCLLDILRQLKAATTEAEASEIHDSVYQLNKNEYTRIRCGKCSESSITESSDEIEIQNLEEVSDGEETSFYDTKDYFLESPSFCVSSENPENTPRCLSGSRSQTCTMREMKNNKEYGVSVHMQVERRKKLPDPVEKLKAVSLWSLIKDNVGKDLTRVCLPVYFNEPISSLQKCFEDLEYSYLLDRAYECGKVGDYLGRMANVVAFAVSSYASSEGRHCKPFNPLLGETYEAEFPEKGIRFISEKVSHHPTVLACHCEGTGWKFWGESNLKTKFWGQTIQLDPLGPLTLEFDDGEVFQWSKVTTSICNLILGKIYCDHHGTMNIKGNRRYSCKVKFKAQSFLDRRNAHQVDGIIEDVSGIKVGMVVGKWVDSLYFVKGDGNGRTRGQSSDASMLWTRTKPPINLTRYNLTSFAITLNELTPGLLEKLPTTDSRLRPDQRHLENGEYEKANAEKLRLEKRQRVARRIQESGWKPRWFAKAGEDGPYRYIGGYWEARKLGKWDGCPDIFGEFTEDRNASFIDS